MKKTLLLSILLHSFAYAQVSVLPFSQEYRATVDGYRYASQKNAHTSVLPYLQYNDNQQRDTSFLTFTDSSKHTTFLGRKLWTEHLLQYRDSSTSIYFDFYPEANIGLQTIGSKKLYTNSRGFVLGSTLGKKWGFYSDFYETQANLPQHIANFVNLYNVVPGQGLIKFQGTTLGTDYASANGYITYAPAKYFWMQAGQGRNFIGDGYRSMLLSDNAYSYPFVKLQTTIGPIQYTNLYTVMQHIYGVPYNGRVFPRKYGTFHYADVAVTKRLKIGVFEAIIFKQADSLTGYRGFDANYLNPIIFFRPVEYGIGSPDNALLGVNASYTLTKQAVVYGQILLDEFKAKEYLKNRGWWGNKYAYQIGVKWHNAFNLPHLYLQIEHNTATPYTYSHFDPITNYGHYNQALAHPLGANFKEFLGIARYRYRRWGFMGECQYATYGTDASTGDVGKNIYLSYGKRNQEYGNFTGQGIATKLLFATTEISYLFNPKNNLGLMLAYTVRKENSSLNTYIQIGIKAGFGNKYYDF